MSRQSRGKECSRTHVHSGLQHRADFVTPQPLRREKPVTSTCPIGYPVVQLHRI